MNGQQGRKLIAEAIITTCGIQKIVETGTWRGDTTAWLASFGRPVFSIEVDPFSAEFCRRRLSGISNVQLSEGDSAKILKALPAETIPILFYLDAHWGIELPLAQELQIIGNRFPSAIALIDDFKVPDDSGYGFDTYGANELSIEYLYRNSVKAPVYLPVICSNDETGSKRGCAALAFGDQMTTALDNVRLLRRWQ